MLTDLALVVAAIDNSVRVTTPVPLKKTFKAEVTVFRFGELR
jgi:hypothetical protein